MNMLMRLGVVSLVAAGPLVELATAQNNYYSRNKYEAVTDRRQPEFDPSPVRVGGLLVNTRAEIAAVATDNVFASSSNEQSDTIIRIGARADVRTDWSNHEIGFRVSGNRDNYLDLNDQSTTNLRSELRGRLDATRNLSFGASAFADMLTESRTEQANANGLDDSIDYDRTGGTLSATYTADRVRLASSVSVADFNYEDGTLNNGATVFDQDFRDRADLRAQARLSYAISPDLAVFAQGAVGKSDYDNAQFFNATTGQVVDPATQPGVFVVRRVRDSKNYTVQVGTNFELQSLIRGDIAVGYFDDNKEDPSLADSSGLSVDGRVQWFPTRLTTVEFRAGRQVVDLGLINAATSVQSRFGVGVDHELRRNIIVSLDAAAVQNKYEDIDRDEDVLQFGASALYKMNKRVHFEAFARRLDRDVSGSQVFGSPDYDVNVVGVGLRLYP